MKCPICGKELELKNKQIGTNENGDPIFNEYAICRDCRKQWNLDKQRAKKAAAKKPASAEASAKKAATTKKPATPEKAPAKKSSVPKDEPMKKAPVQGKADTLKKTPAQKNTNAPKKTPAQENADSLRRTPGQKAAPQKGAIPKDGVQKTGAPRPKRRTSEEEVSSSPAKKPIKKRSANGTAQNASDEKRYSNIPPERVRTKHETAARQGYEDMLATGTIGKPARKKKTQTDDDTRAIGKAPVSKTDTKQKNAAAKPVTKKPGPEIDEYDDDYYEDAPRFRVMRVLLAIISLAGFGYLMYRGFSFGLSSAESGTVSGMTFVILALCLLVSALVYFITLGTNSVFAFLLPMLFYLGGGVFAFLKRGDEFQLLIAAGACAVLAIITLILAITSRGGDYDEDYDDDYADDDYDD